MLNSFFFSALSISCPVDWRSRWANDSVKITKTRKPRNGAFLLVKTYGQKGCLLLCYLAICFSRISSSVLQSMHSVAVGRASRRERPISMPQLSQ